MQRFLTSVRELDTPAPPPPTEKPKVEPRRERRRKAREAVKANKSRKAW
jgi:hypothetical protein